MQYMDDGTDAPGTVPTTATEQEEEAQQGGDRELAATPFEALLAEVDDGPAAAPAAAPAAQPQPPGSSADGPLDNALVPIKSFQAVVRVRLKWSRYVPYERPHAARCLLIEYCVSLRGRLQGDPRDIC